MNLLPVGTGVLASADKVIGTDPVLLFIADADGGYPPQDCQVNVEFKTASGQYMRQLLALTFDRPALVLDAPAGTTFRVKRIAGNVGIDAQGVT